MLKNECSIKDTTILRNLILENPDLPVIFFCGEDSWDGEYQYTQAYASSGEIKSLTLYDDYWMDEDEYRDELSDDLADEEEYKSLSDEDYEKVIDEKVKNTEFVSAIVIYVG
ncbi:hypothetical protein [Roseburia hominis]|uniref:hypothetical protein n=1 Tax=Roseburia hominis TaxID=301301 RepID=UPI002672E9FC|nr:hypothetical protein [Roseburia hominis]